MPDYIAQAATLTTPEGVSFLAFVDLKGHVTCEAEAVVLLAQFKRHSSFPATLSYRVNGVWQTSGNTLCSKFVAGLDPGQLPLEPVILTFRGGPPKQD